jgi:hypothetical protein
MTKDEIIEAAVKAEAERRGAIDADLVTMVFDLSKIRVVDGEAVASDVKKRVDEIRREKPLIFRERDARKMNDEAFAQLEQELRKPDLREIEERPAYVRQVDASQLTETENEALRAVLCGSKQSYHHGVVERAARRQGISTTPAAA